MHGMQWGGGEKVGLQDLTTAHTLRHHEDPTLRAMAGRRKELTSGSIPGVGRVAELQVQDAQSPMARSE